MSIFCGANRAYASAASLLKTTTTSVPSFSPYDRWRLRGPDEEG